ncbi:tyrosine-type recombinase/integrase [Nonomuraea sp. NPDC004354]
MASTDLARVEAAELVEVEVDVPLAGHTDADLYLSPTTRRRLVDGQRPNTRRSYTRQWQNFVRWCAHHGRTPLVATPETLAEYVAELCDREMAPATIDQAIATVRAAHRTAGHPKTPDTGPALLVLRGYKRERAENGQRNQRQAPPVLIPELRQMIEACDLTTARGLRDRLLLVLGLALMGRRSELVALMVSDVLETSEGLEVTIRTSKTDKDSRGETIAIPAGAHPLTNPVAALADWVACLADHGVTDGRLLRRIDRHGNIGESLSDSSVNTILRDLAAAAELPNAEAYTAHSLRAGGATVAYAAGVPVQTIAKHGRWDPQSPVVLRYIRAVDRWRDNAMRSVGL